VTQRGRASAATREFVAAIPELQAALDEHVRGYDELLPHVFFGDVSRFARDVATTRNEALARRLADALERMAASPDDDVVNVIHVSFVEYFVWGDEGDQAAFEWLSRFFRPAMLARTEEFREYSAKLHAAWEAGALAGREPDRHGARFETSEAMHELTEFGGGKRLLEAEDGALHLRTSDGRLHEVDLGQPIELLPLLETDRAAYPRDVLAKLPLRELLLVALRWETEYWPMLAVKGMGD
jgi:hypothetical protein